MQRSESGKLHANCSDESGTAGGQLLVSADMINDGPSNLAMVLPLTTRERDIDLHVTIESGDGGVRERSVALPEQVHAVDQQRLVERWGRLSAARMLEIEFRLRVALDLA